MQQLLCLPAQLCVTSWFRFGGQGCKRTRRFGSAVHGHSLCCVPSGQEVCRPTAVALQSAQPRSRARSTVNTLSRHRKDAAGRRRSVRPGRSSASCNVRDHAAPGCSLVALGVGRSWRADSNRGPADYESLRAPFPLPSARVRGPAAAIQSCTASRASRRALRERPPLCDADRCEGTHLRRRQQPRIRVQASSREWLRRYGTAARTASSRTSFASRSRYQRSCISRVRRRLTASR